RGFRPLHCHGLPVADRVGFLRVPSLVAGAFAQRVSLLARPWLRHRRAVCRSHDRLVRRRYGDRGNQRAHVRLRSARRRRHERGAGPGATAEFRRRHAAAGFRREVSPGTKIRTHPGEATMIRVATNGQAYYSVAPQTDTVWHELLSAIAREVGKTRR